MLLCAVYYYVVIYRNKYTHQTKAECRTQENKCKRIYTKSFFFIITTTYNQQDDDNAALPLCLYVYVAVLLMWWWKLESRVYEDLYQKKDKIRSCKNNFFFVMLLLVVIIFFKLVHHASKKLYYRVEYRDVMYNLFSRGLLANYV